MLAAILRASSLLSSFAADRGGGLSSKKMWASACPFASHTTNAAARSSTDQGGGKRRVDMSSQIRLYWTVPLVVTRHARRMKTIAQFRMYAEECRKLAASARVEDKQTLDVIAHDLLRYGTH
jgi:hypothetical protein